jgi:hypothetical protein
MYFFVRFTGVTLVILGALAMLAGVGIVVYGFVQHAQLLALTENYVWAGINQPLPDPRMALALLGLVTFFAGMFKAAMGQLLLVFADIATQTRETNALLRGLKKN